MEVTKAMRILNSDSPDTQTVIEREAKQSAPIQPTQDVKHV